MAIIAAGGTDLYCHSEPPLTSGKLCFIINFIGGGARVAEFLLGAAPLLPPFEPPLRFVIRCREFLWIFLSFSDGSSMSLKLYFCNDSLNILS